MAKKHQAKRDSRAAVLPTSTIAKMHGYLGSMLSTLLRQSVHVRTVDDGDWTKAAAGARVLWYLVAERAERAESRERGEPVCFLPCQVGSVDDSSPYAWWVSWMEEWVSCGNKRFAFRTAGWKVFCGPSGLNTSKQLILRADWGPLAVKANETLAFAGQPHWHSELQLNATSERPLPSEADVLGRTPTEEGQIRLAVEGDEQVMRIGGDADLAPRGGGGIVDFSGVHLPMAGWQNSPARWQHVVDAQFTTALREWCIATLEYLKSQIQYMVTRRGIQ